MAKGSDSFFDKLAQGRVSNRWATAAASAEETELSRLRKQREEAKSLQNHLNTLLHVADGRLALPRIGSNSFPRPSGSLWAWRPQIWRGPLSKQGVASVQSKTKLGDEVRVFHDCSASEITLRQIRNTREGDLAPFGLKFDVFNFNGSFLSLVLDFPNDATEGLTRRHILRVSSFIEAESPLEVFLRLNIKNGPNTEQLVQELTVNKEDAMVEFDLAYADLNEKRLGDVWMDLIFENPKMNQIVVRDITFCRYPRAEL